MVSYISFSYKNSSGFRNWLLWVWLGAVHFGRVILSKVERVKYINLTHKKNTGLVLGSSING